MNINKTLVINLGLKLEFFIKYTDFYKKRYVYVN